MALNGSTILITGGARRIGKILSLTLARAGANIVIHHGHSAHEAAETAQEIQSLGRQAWILEADLNDPQSAINLIDRAWDCAPLSALINNAAIFESLSFEETSLEDWQRHLNINLSAPFLISQRFAARLPVDQPGRILNILDWRATRPGADHFAYTISKAALAAMTFSLAQVLAPRIQVNGLGLGAILPPADGQNSERVLEQVPAQRWADQKELEQTVLFLLDGPRYITGDILYLDGGRHTV